MKNKSRWLDLQKVLLLRIIEIVLCAIGCVMLWSLQYCLFYSHQALKEEGSRLTEEYGYCLLDGHREKIGNFRVEPPGLFRGRGEHPKMGKLKKRIHSVDVIINCSK